MAVVWGIPGLSVSVSGISVSTSTSLKSDTILCFQHPGWQARWRGGEREGAAGQEGKVGKRSNGHAEKARCQKVKLSGSCEMTPVSLLYVPAWDQWLRGGGSGCADSSLGLVAQGADKIPSKCHRPQRTDLTGQEIGSCLRWSPSNKLSSGGLKELVLP